MNLLPLDLQSLIINITCCKCSCLNICKTWEKLLKNDLPECDLIGNVMNRDYYAIQYNTFSFRYKLFEIDIIDMALNMNDDIILKLIINWMSEQESFYEQIVYLLEGIFRIGNFKVLKYIFVCKAYKILYDEMNKPYKWTTKFINNIENNGLITSTDFKLMDKYIRYIPNESYIFLKLKRGNLIGMLVLSYNKFQYEYNIKIKNDSNKLPNYQEKAYFECIRHGLYGIIKNIDYLESIHKIYISLRRTLFFLSLSGTADIEDVLKYANFNHDLYRNKINKFITKLNIRDRYTKILDELF